MINNQFYKLKKWLIKRTKMLKLKIYNLALTKGTLQQLITWEESDCLNLKV